MTIKKCFKCGIEKPLEEFYHHPLMSDGRLGKCKDCTRIDVRKNRNARSAFYNKLDQSRYRLNILRMWGIKYISMRRRVLGLTTHSKLIGKDLISKKEFIEWCHVTKPAFMKIYNNWKKGGYKRMFAPSIDRIDNNKGYVIGNMQWITQSDNAKKSTK